MLEHPWIELQLLIKEKWLTQKAFASILWKKVSEVNELLKWKRNITIQRDYLLHQTLWTPIKYWILKQIDYDYSLIDIDESQHQDVILSVSEESREDWKSQKSSLSEKDLGEVSEGLGESWSRSEQSEEFTTHQTCHSEPEGHENPSSTKPMDFSLQSKWQPDAQDFSSLHSSEWQDKHKDDEDFKKRARIFKSF